MYRRDNLTWQTAQGEILPMRVMEPKHLVNTLHRLERQAKERRDEAALALECKARRIEKKRPDEAKEAREKAKKLNEQKTIDMASRKYPCYVTLRKIAIERGLIKEDENAMDAKLRRQEEEWRAQRT